jgi:hypothetical protein
LDAAATRPKPHRPFQLLRSMTRLWEFPIYQRPVVS